jgi:hypothetical protein
MKTQSTRPSRPPQSTRTTSDKTIGGALDLAAPRALWRLIQIGETAGLVTPADRTATVTAFGSTARRLVSVGRVLDGFQCSATELYLLVTLFAASRPLSCQTLARETLADPASLRSALDHLGTLAATSVEFTADGESLIRLTQSGQARAVMLMYRVLQSALSTNRANSVEAHR